ncbi:MAG TPA: sensor histidine kinase [Candidatus Dormibacteraeota bacterium]|nr:sensor histidine kinase [Candidatus Dormibacteraeota bacterium]
MEVVALPADRRPQPSLADDGPVRAEASKVRPRSKRRAAASLENAQQAAFVALRAVSSYSDKTGDISEFFSGLAETLAGLVKARRVAFWHLGPRRVLTVQPKPYGFPARSPIHAMRIRTSLDQNNIAERAVFQDELELVGGTVPELDALWSACGLDGLKNSIAVSWRAGDRRLGTLVAYDSRRGFTPEDAWVLRVAAMATGMMWQYREAEQKLDTTAERLEQAATARRQLLGNIAAGGDEARRRFASALHDDSLQLLTAAELQLERIQSDSQASKPAHLEQLKATLKQVEESLRRLLLNVSPQAIEVPLGLDEAIRTRLESLRSRAGIETDIDLRLPSQLPASIEAVVFKNVSEALTNVEKHALATRIEVAAYPADGGLRVVVRDDGKGFVVAESMYLPGHLGLTAIRERAQLAGGRCRIESEPGAGARVEFWVPIKQ